MATATEFVLPEKYTDDLKDENGNPMSKRWGLLSPRAVAGRCGGGSRSVTPFSPPHPTPTNMCCVALSLVAAVSSRSARRQLRRQRRQQRRR